jgi:hypothetical protein
MESLIWVETRLAGRMLEFRQVASVERSAIGIESKKLDLALRDVQAETVRTQISVLDTALVANWFNVGGR